MLAYYVRNAYICKFDRWAYICNNELCMMRKAALQWKLSSILGVKLYWHISIVSIEHAAFNKYIDCHSKVSLTKT